MRTVAIRPGLWQGLPIRAWAVADKRLHLIANDHDGGSFNAALLLQKGRNPVQAVEDWPDREMVALGVGLTPTAVGRGAAILCHRQVGGRR